jgi:hypothetical protein
MKFSTEIEIEPCQRKITYADKIMLLGSCFAENIEKKLARSKFRTDVNPMGIVYNPASLLNCFELLDKNKVFTKTDLFEENGIWKSFYHHSRFSHPDIDVTLNNINSKIQSSTEFLKKTDHIFLTLGTAWVYEHIERSILVSNCHKVASSNFRHKLLSVDDTTVYLKSIVLLIKKINPGTSITITLSPVRHLKDGTHNNQISKSTLLLAIHNLQQEFPDIFYFPAYEILLDELRDYRYYADDMIHPSNMAVEYIWQKFTETFMSQESILLVKEIENITQATQHRPLFRESQEFSKFTRFYYEKVCNLMANHPEINLQEEKQFFASFHE